MKYKYLITLLSTSILTSSISPAWGQDNTSSEITFACEDNNGVPITVAKNKKGQAENIFYWRKEALASKTPSTPQELCDAVSARLNQSSINGYDFSTFTLLGSEQSGIPTICAGFSKQPSCTKALFTLSAVHNPGIVADFILGEIINPEIGKKYRDVDWRTSLKRYQFNLPIFLENEQ